MRTIRLGGIVLLSAAAYAGQPGSIDVQGIIRKSVAVTEANWKRAPNYAYVERDATSKKNHAVNAKSYEVVMIDGSPYNKVIAINDRPLSKQEQAAEEQKLQAETANRQHEGARERKRRIAKYERERSQDQALMKEMADAFDFKFVGETKMDGRDTYEFVATPKPGYVPKTRDTKVLTAMRGTLWVDKQTNQWVKVEAQVMRPVAFYGFFAKVGPGTRFELEQAPVGGDLWLPKHFAMKVNASALGFLNENSTDDETYSNYRPMGASSGLRAMK